MSDDVTKEPTLEPSDELPVPKPRVVPKLRPGPKGGKRDANRRRRTKEIADAALQLFLQQGIKNVTIDDIVKAAGIAKGSFYRYFKDKTDLVEALFAPYLAHIDQAFARSAEALRQAKTRDDTIGAYRVLAESLGELFFHNPDGFVLFLQENRAPAVGERKVVRELATLIDRRAVELTELALERGLLRSVNPRVSARVVVGAVEKLAFDLLSGEDLGEPAEVPEILIEMVLGGLRPEAT